MDVVLGHQVQFIFHGFLARQAIRSKSTPSIYMQSLRTKTKGDSGCQKASALPRSLRWEANIFTTFLLKLRRTLSSSAVGAAEVLTKQD